MTIQDLEKIYNGEKKSITKKVDGFKVNAKIMFGSRIVLSIDGDIIADSVSDFDYLIEVMNEKIEEEKDLLEFDEEQEKLLNERLKEEDFKQFSLSEVKVILKKIIDKSYFGQEKEAYTGSEYLTIYGKTVRFSDHIRPATSKWNFIHGENKIDAPEGLIFKNDFINFIENRLGIKKYDKNELDNIFK